MEQQSTAEAKKGFLQNNRLLVSSMFVFYGLCLIGLIAVTFRWLEGRQQTISANSTSTALARLAEQDQYEYIERFDTISGHWPVGEDKDEYGEVITSIKNGVYIWEIIDPKGYLYGTTLRGTGPRIKNFDVYVDIKFVDIPSDGDTCSGLVFRKYEPTWNGGGYIFSICNNSRFAINYFTSNNSDTITYEKRFNVIQMEGWNRIEVSARGENFQFTINNVMVYEMTDGRRKDGVLGLSIKTEESGPSVIWFDNFGYQVR